MLSSDHLIEAAILGVATAAISVTCARAKVFASARRRVRQVSEWLGDLVSCAYCTSHWVALFLVWAYQVRMFFGWRPLDVLVTTMFVVAESAVLIGIITGLINFGPPDARDEKKRT